MASTSSSSSSSSAASDDIPFPLSEVPRFVSVADGALELRVDQADDNSGDLLGASVWDCALSLGSYVQNTQRFPYKYFENITKRGDSDASPADDGQQHKVILELGSGTGYMSLILAALGARHVFATDGDERLVKLIHHNAKQNPMITDRVVARVFKWGEDLSELRELAVSRSGRKPASDFKFDVVVAADVGAKCYADSWDAFVETLCAATDRHSFVLLAHEMRDPLELDFFKKLQAAGFKLAKVGEDLLDPDWIAEDIGIFELRREA